MGAPMLLIATLVWGVLATASEGPVPQVCGKPKNSPQPLQRIIGGRMSGKGLFPWQGRLVSPHNLTAGATLISDQWVLTTARNIYLGQNACASPEDIAPTLQLFLGNRGQLPAGAVERVVLHPNFNSTDCNGTSNSDTCHGDAGGAFAVHDPDDDTWYAAGILTYDRTCAAAKYSVYASVQHALAWIRQTMDES
ncbi:haptoglobin [Alligator sinensis]|uniref:Haptoglobin n=1 Tax=Alligator sinensis TaxID=38654 RepID=A0A1U7S7A7_ALLSI|nr:haptoglobin [Alligator sinensis]